MFYGSNTHRNAGGGFIRARAAGTVMSLSATVLLITTVLLLAVTPAGAGDKTPQGQQYVAKWSATAVSEMRRTGIPASITLAQGMLESGNGQSELAVKANNHFGIKCHEWKGATFTADDDRKGECFRKYSSAEESYKDHSDFLRYRDRYKPLFSLKITDYEGWAYGLKQAGYATDPNYPTKLIDLIETYNLSRFDSDKGLPDTPYALETPVMAGEKEAVRFTITRPVYCQNKVPFVYSVAGETYGSIAESNNLFLSEILRYNDLDEEEELLPGSVVYLQAKKNKAARHVEKYVAEGGESLWEISQRYGVKLKKLAKMNDVGENFLARKNNVIKLR